LRRKVLASVAEDAVDGVDDGGKGIEVALEGVVLPLVRVIEEIGAHGFHETCDIAVIMHLIEEVADVGRSTGLPLVGHGASLISFGAWRVHPLAGCRLDVTDRQRGGAPHDAGFFVVELDRERGLKDPRW
jgi:hypothetical protein